MTAAARVYLCIGLTAIAVYVAVGGSHLIYEAFGSVGALAMFVGALRNRPARRRAWLTLAASQVLFAIADIVYFDGYSGPAPFPSVADYFYLVGDLVFIGALFAIVRDRHGVRRELAALADAVVFSAAIGLLLWSVFFNGAIGDGDGLAHLFSIGYPVLDLLIVTMLVRALLERGRRTTSYWLVAAGAVLLVLSDCWYVLPALTDRYVAGTWRDAGWLGSYLCLATAVLDPSMRDFVRRSGVTVPARRVLALGGSLVVVAASAVVQQALRGDVNVYAFGAIGSVMALFITLRIVGLVRDVEQMRKQAEMSERRFRMVFERAPVGISVGSDGIMGETNPALHRMLGYTADEFAQMHYTDVTYDDDLDRREQRELDQATRDSFSIDKRYTSKDGRVIDAHVHVALDLEDGLGISIIEDVTRRRELEDQLRHAQKMEAVGKLAGGIAHDFNNLMTAVLGYSDLILAGLDDDDPNRAKIESIREASVRANDLTRQLLAFGRRQMLQAADVDVREVVAGMDSLLGTLIGEDVAIVTALGDEPAIVLADPTQLERVVVNLAVNARDAMREGGTLTISVAREGDVALLVVEDDGNGMDAATLSRIFEPFFTTKPVGAGSGLGLSTVHGIVGQSGGLVDVESEPGNGTRFTVRLPLAGTPPLLPDVPATATLVD